MEAADDTAPLKVQLPRAAAPLPAPAAAGKPEATGEAERNPIFDALVSPDEDIAGLVAYSIYKQNKRAWLDDFIKATGRSPTEAESRAYIIGESTERRLTTYRHLAAATLSGQGPRAPAPGGAPMGKHNPVVSALWALVIVIVAAGVLALAVHAGYLGSSK